MPERGVKSPEARHQDRASVQRRDQQDEQDFGR